MEKNKILLSNLKRIHYPKSNCPKDIFTEQELSYNHESSYTHYYECPCGKGRVVDDKDATPGFRCHDIYIECEECNKKYTIG